MKIPIFLSLLCLTLMPVSGQPLTEEKFLAGIADTTWEASFSSYSRFSFENERTNVLDDKGEVSRKWKTEIVEPGLIRGTFNDDLTIWFCFNDDLDTFCSPNVMRDWARYSAFTIEGEKNTEWPGLKTNPDSIATLQLEKHDRWASIKLGSKTATPVLKDGTDGEPFRVFRYHDHATVALTNIPNQKSVGCFILSRSGNKGWYTEGPTVASGAKTFRNRIATANFKSTNKGFTRRSNQFSWYLQNMDKMEQAYAQEHYAEYHMLNLYGEDSERTVDGLRVMGIARASAFQPKQGPYWLKKARDLGKIHFAADPEKIIDLEVGLARAQYRAGEYDAALETLKNMEQQPVWNDDFTQTDNHYVQVISGVAFSKAEYDKAEKWQRILATESAKYNYTNWVLDGHLGVVACRLAKRDREGALMALKDAITFQEDRQKANPASNYATEDLSFACTALEQWEAALKYSYKGNNRNACFKYEEVARLLALWNKGNKAEAVAFANHINERFRGDFSSAWRSSLYSEMYIAIIEVLSDPESAEKVSKFREVWAGQKALLKARPLQNFIYFYVVSGADRLLGWFLSSVVSTIKNTARNYPLRHDNKTMIVK